AVMMRLDVAAHRPLGQMSNQAVAGDLELGEEQARPLPLRGVDLRLADVRDEIRLPEVRLILAALAAWAPPVQHEVVRLAAEPLAERERRVVDEGLVVKEVKHQGSRRERGVPHGLPHGEELVRAVQGDREQASLMPLEGML